MKKTLIALAAVAATGAFAQSSVTLSGTMDATLRATSTTSSTGTSNNSKLGQNGSGTTGITFSGTEDLGGGLKALFLYEMDFDMTVSGNNRNGTVAGSTTTNSTAVVGPVGGGQSYVGLSGGFGTLKLGVPNAPSLTVQGARSPFGTKDGGRAGVYSGLMGTSVTRLDNSINYTTPTFAGFNASLSHTPGQSDASLDAGSEGGTISDLGVFYNNGPLVAGVSRFARSTYAAVDASQQTSWYVSYDFKVVKATLGGHTQAVYSTANARTETNGLSLGLELPLTASATLQYSYQRLDDTSANNRDSQMNAIGVNYGLSKRSSVYARYGYQTTDNVAAGSTEKGSVTLVGLRHNF
jgi:predicted porin